MVIPWTDEQLPETDIIDALTKAIVKPPNQAVVHVSRQCLVLFSLYVASDADFGFSSLSTASAAVIISSDLKA